MGKRGPKIEFDDEFHKVQREKVQESRLRKNSAFFQAVKAVFVEGWKQEIETWKQGQYKQIIEHTEKAEEALDVEAREIVQGWKKNKKDPSVPVNQVASFINKMLEADEKPVEDAKEPVEEENPMVKQALKLLEAEDAAKIAVAKHKEKKQKKKAASEPRKMESIESMFKKRQRERMVI